MSTRKNRVIYLTGAPASGKSSLTKAVAKKYDDIAVFEYGRELTTLLNEKSKGYLKQEDLRRRSSEVITANIVRELDRNLIKWIRNNRAKKHIIIDSHAVTKESYGYRVIPFSLTQLSKLCITDIVVLFCDSGETVRRVSASSGGRPLLNEKAFEMHASLQASVALAYAVSLGLKTYFFDSVQPTEMLADYVASHVLKD